MKQRITPKDLEGLTDDQKRRLNQLWAPSIYDVAIARVLKNVATEEYDEYEFVIGGISLYGTSIYLSDIRAGSGAQADDSGTETGTAAAEADDTSVLEDPIPSIKVDTFSDSIFGFGKKYSGRDEEESDEGEAGEQEEEKEDFREEDLENNYQLPSAMIKEECTPLLTIGNMIEILQKNNFGNFDFFLSASTYDIGCQLGKGDSSWGNYSDWEAAELCDVLWESVKAIL